MSTGCTCVKYILALRLLKIIDNWQTGMSRLHHDVDLRMLLYSHSDIVFINPVELYWIATIKIFWIAWLFDHSVYVLYGTSFMSARRVQNSKVQRTHVETVYSRILHLSSLVEIVSEWEYIRRSIHSKANVVLMFGKIKVLQSEFQKLWIYVILCYHCWALRVER
jgi:hypothetical protein